MTRSTAAVPSAPSTHAGAPILSQIETPSVTVVDTQTAAMISNHRQVSQKKIVSIKIINFYLQSGKNGAEFAKCMLDAVNLAQASVLDLDAPEFAGASFVAAGDKRQREAKH